MPRRRKAKSKRKQDAIRHNCGIAAWRQAASEYLRKGKFIHLPKKGTEEHAIMKRRQKELMPIVQKEIDELILKEKEEEKKRKLSNASKRQAEVEWLRKKRDKEITKTRDETNLMETEIVHEQPMLLHGSSPKKSEVAAMSSVDMHSDSSSDTESDECVLVLTDDEPDTDDDDWV
jgi:hypothetical protein